MIIQVTGKCSYEGCEEKATHIACGYKNTEPACYCLPHAKIVADEGYPEYTDECPNCGCRFGVS